MPQHRRGTEREALAAVLDEQRAALVRKVVGVSEQDARRTPTVSTLSLLALLKHCTVWEERWVQGVFAGRPLDDGWPDRPGEPDAELLLTADDTVAVWRDRYLTATAASRAIAAASPLEARCARHDVADADLRWVLLHLVQETARHAGHADLLRETLDGSRGL